MTEPERRFTVRATTRDTKVYRGGYFEREEIIPEFTIPWGVALNAFDRLNGTPATWTMTIERAMEKADWQPDGLELLEALGAEFPEKESGPT